MRSVKMKKGSLFTAVSIISGTCIGAGFLGIPYVAAKAGFFVTMVYLILIGGAILLVNLYLGETLLRTKGDHQLTGYVYKYLGKNGKRIMLFASQFLIYSALVAYMLGVGESVSFMFFGNLNHSVLIGAGFGVIMSLFLIGGMSSETKIEKFGVSIALALLFLIFFIFFKRIDLNNLYTFDINNIFLPLGVILFSTMSFFALPEAKLILNNNKKLMKKAIIIGTILPIIFYALFTFLVVGFKGAETPQIATLALGNIFILLGIIAIFTSYMALAVALQQTHIFDLKHSKKRAWILSGIYPIGIFLITRLFDFFSFINILSIAGIVSGGIIGILILASIKKAKKNGDRTPEYQIKINNFIIGVLSILFLLGIVQVLLIFK